MLKWRKHVGNISHLFFNHLSEEEESFQDKGKETRTRHKAQNQGMLKGNV